MRKPKLKEKNPPVSLIITVFNEAKTVDHLLKALKEQTHPATEIIIVDGGSTDETWTKLQSWSKQLPQLHIFHRSGNRAIGRNLAIKKSRYQLIAITDAGCIPQKKWLEILVKKYLATKADVIAGYYQGAAYTPLTEAIIPYVLVMPDKVDQTNFLPATRSMLLTKKIWRKIGGFDETLDSSEDYDFALRLVEAKAEIAFADKALVTWWPRTTLADFAVMIVEFAFWDIRAGHLRKKVQLLFLRYIVFFLLLSIYFETHAYIWLLILIFISVVYLIWAITKNKRYAPHGWYWLPVLQLLSDLMVMGGSILGFIDRIVVNQSVPK